MSAGKPCKECKTILTYEEQNLNNGVCHTCTQKKRGVKKPVVERPKRSKYAPPIPDGEMPELRMMAGEIVSYITGLEKGYSSHELEIDIYKMLKGNVEFTALFKQDDE